MRTVPDIATFGARLRERGSDDDTATAWVEATDCPIATSDGQFSGTILANFAQPPSGDHRNPSPVDHVLIAHTRVTSLGS